MSTEMMLFAIIVALLGVNLAMVNMLTGSKIANPFEKMTEAREKAQELQEDIKETENIIDELSQSERDFAFQKRIDRMKDELANDQNFAPRHGYAAHESHPDVQNLPHSIISDTHSDSIEGEEYAK